MATKNPIEDIKPAKVASKSKKYIVVAKKNWDAHLNDNGRYIDYHFRKAPEGQPQIEYTITNKDHLEKFLHSEIDCVRIVREE